MNPVYDSVKECSYNQNIKDFISKNILELYKLDKSTKFFKVIVGNDKIIVANYKIKVTFKERLYDVPILIYFPINFPKFPPELYIENQSGIGINPKNNDINQSTRRITVSKIKNWNVYSTISSVVDDCQVSFNKEFPIFKKQSTGIGGHSQSQVNLSNDFSVLNMNNNNSEIRFDGKGGNGNGSNIDLFQSISQPSISNVSSSQWNNQWNSNTNTNNQWNVNSNNQNTNQNVSNSNDVYNAFFGTQSNTLLNNNINNNQYTNNSLYNNINNSIYNNSQYSNNSNITNNTQNQNYELEIKKKLIEDLKSSLESKIREEILQIKKQEDILSNYKKEFNTILDAFASYSVNKTKANQLLYEYILSINDEISNIKDVISKRRSKGLTQENYEEYILKNNVELIKACCMEGCLDEVIMVVKKGFDKGAISFEDAMRIIRRVSKEIFIIRFYKERLSAVLKK